jgi:methyl-accepting chemotaxis protein
MENKVLGFKRRKILVEKRSQIYLSLMVTLYLVVFTIVMLAVILIPSIIRFTRSSLPIEEQFAASREFLLLDHRVVPVFIVSMLLLAVHFLFISNRIFGPLYRLRMVLSAWRSGKWPQPFHGRTRDFHGEFFSAFNKTVEQLKADMGYSREKLRAALRGIEETPPGAALPARLKEAEENCREALKRLDQYELF